MTTLRQTSLAKPAKLRGIGLHNGLPVNLTFEPAPADMGIVFKRGDRFIPARVANVTQTRLCTRLENAAGDAIQTVEHVLAALVVADIDNIILDIDGPEMPAADGSAEPFVEALERAGRVELDAPRRLAVIREKIKVTQGDGFVEIAPDDGAFVDLAVSFEDKAIGRQTIEFDLADRFSMRRRLARARTFCQLSEIEQMRHAGFARGGTLDNAIVVDNGRILNPSGLRDPVEFALHKTLDLVGDFKLLGAPFIGRVRAYKSGHDLHIRALRALLETDGAIDWCDAAPPIKAAGHA